MSAPKPNPVRAISLLSGGLDSRLAVCVLREQGIDVHGVVFESPFFSPEAARKAAEQLRIELHVLPFTGDILELVRCPPHGFGSGMNPCIDCHARMLRRAGDFMVASGFHLLATGEVLDERPMSQNRRSLEIVARDSGYSDVVLRPLSARLLPETRPEAMGWVDRARLLDLRGRSRKPQMELAVRFGITDYPTPAGGCLLTEPNFAGRLRDLKEHEGIDNVRAVERLRVGRHFRLDSRTKLVVGRNRQDNDFLEQHATQDDLVLAAEGIPGPTAVLPASAPLPVIERAASICARYSDFTPGTEVTVSARGCGVDRRLTVRPADPATTDALMVKNPRQ